MKRFLASMAMVTAGCFGEASADTLRIAAASDLKFAMDEIAAEFQKRHSTDTIEVIYGSSGNFHAQIQQGAPFDLFFSADIEYPRSLAGSGFAASAVRPYATGRIVLWSARVDASKLTLADLGRQEFAKIAIANPTHAPYGKRAEEALRSSGVWDQVERKLVYGENIAQTAQFVQSQNADVGIIALSLALNLELASAGAYYLIPASLHSPLEQGFIVTRRAADNALAAAFADHMGSAAVRTTMARHGFVLPNEETGDSSAIRK